MTTTETTMDQLVDTYFAAWNEPDRTARLALAAQVFTDDAHYVDPLSDVTGHDALVDMVDTVRGQFPGATLERTGEIDAHHNLLRFPWHAVGDDGSVIVAGLDVAVLAPDGRLTAVAGFFEH